MIFLVLRRCGAAVVRICEVMNLMLEAAETLARASRTKSAALMVLVVTHRGSDLAFGQALPTGVIAVDGPALQVREALVKVTATLSAECDAKAS